MKTKLTILFISVMAAASILTTVAARANEANYLNQELCKETILRLINEDVIKIVREKYGDDYIAASYDMEIVQLKKDNQNIRLTVRLMPYTGPHNYISKDEATFLVKRIGLELLDYEQLERFH